MKTCLGMLLMLPALIGLAVTGVYHVSVNSSLNFEKLDSQEDYVNKHRSYAPADPTQTPAAAPATSAPAADGESSSTNAPRS
ncbi:MAG TPA: hypothetical protein H9862_07370 [Candidatus Akkermansia intestinigallinarum]|uniref:Uncharacterized protein n=1 Tax=Candidatus Akkermansia intestinigallinarum TaxID=2838431 RepID=A0A9D1VC03_9BACT|nr:hypothetical protein [Candidatus Akkermansia intestinigallinarum]